MKRLSLAILSSLVLAANAYADVKIGVVNMDEVAQKSPLAMSYNDKISKDFKPRQDAVNAAQQKLQNDVDQFSYASYKMSLNDRTKLQATINNDKREFETLSLSLQRDLAAAQAQYTQALMGKLGTIITKIAQDGRYDIIQTNANMLFLNNTVNITPQVIEQLK